MHPVIAIATTLVTLGFLAAGGPATLIAVGGLLLVAYLQVQPALAGARRMLRQLRWLLLSILVLYLWFTPGEPMLAQLGAVSPSWAGFSAGLERAIILVLMVLVVNLLLVKYATAELCGGMYWLLAPFARIGFPAERLSLRLSLTLDAVARVRDQVAAARQATPATPQGRLRRFGALAASLYQAVLDDARARPVADIDIDILAAPPVWQWFIPLAVTALLVSFGAPGLGGIGG